VFDLNEKFPTLCHIFPASHVRSRHAKKRKRSLSFSESPANAAATGKDDDDNNDEATDADPKQSSCTMCLRYNSMLCVEFVGSNEMVIVEQPWLNVVANFPEALHRRVYGAN